MRPDDGSWRRFGGPPRLTERLLHAALPPGIVGESIVGDLREEHGRPLATVSRREAGWWYRRQALGSVAGCS